MQPSGMEALDVEQAEIARLEALARKIDKHEEAGCHVADSAVLQARRSPNNGALALLLGHQTFDLEWIEALRRVAVHEDQVAGAVAARTSSRRLPTRRLVGDGPSLGSASCLVYISNMQIVKGDISRLL